MKRHLLIGTGIIIGAAALHGQMKTITEPGSSVFQFTTTGNLEGNVFGAVGSQVVTGKPFSGTEERHSLQVLGDGTRVENNETNRLYRDDQGRTRLERSGGNISIFDPVMGFSAELNPVTKMANKSNVLVRQDRVVGKTTTTGEGGNSAQLAKLKEELSQMMQQSSPQTSNITSLKAQIDDLQKESQTAPQRTSASYAYSYSTSSAPAPADAVKKQMAEQREGGTKTFYFNTVGDNMVTVRSGPGDNAAVENLAPQMINGVMASGTRRTETIPVGKIGNDRPISVVNERWFSSDLQMLVKSMSSDPRFGDTTYQLTNVVQTSPDPSLFEIPADYTIRK